MDSLPIELHIEIRSYLNITDALNYGLVIKELSSGFSNYEKKRRYKNKGFRELIKTGDNLGIRWLIAQGYKPTNQDILLVIRLGKNKIFESIPLFGDRSLFINLAYRVGNLEILKVLLKNNFISPNDAIFELCRNNHYQAVEWLMGIVKSTYVLQHALEIASGYGWIEIVKLFLEFIKPTHNSLLYAATNAHLEIVKLLIMAGVDFRAEDDMALIEGMSLWPFDVAKYLIELGADVNTYDGEPLDIAASHGLRYNNLSMVEYLIAHGAIIPAHKLIRHVPRDNPIYQYLLDHQAIEYDLPALEDTW